ncbi:MAG: hypothetical protein ACRD0O_01785 [Acidimicrobiia bacterium]
MDMRERLTMRRAERQLAGLMEAGERLLEFDTGMTPSGQKVNCVVSTRALYVAVPGGQSARVAYADIARAEARSFWLSLELFSGDELLIDFRGSHRGLCAVVMDLCQPLNLLRY